MFRMVPYKTNHYLTDARVVVNIAFMMMEDNKPEFKFYQLELERSRIDTFTMISAELRLIVLHHHRGNVYHYPGIG